MESQQVNNEEQRSNFDNLRKVTPLSKYLAMMLFVALPFIGGWIGYTLMPEKVVEVERVVVREVEKKVIPTDSLDLILANNEKDWYDSLTVGDVVKGMELIDKEIISESYPDYAYTFSGRMTLSGTIWWPESEHFIIGPFLKVDDESVSAFPYAPIDKDIMISWSPNSLISTDLDDTQITVVADSFTRDFIGRGTPRYSVRVIEVLETR